MTVGFFSNFMLLMNSTLLATVYSDLLSGENDLDRYLASWYNAVPMLDVIGSIVNVPVGVSLFFEQYHKSFPVMSLMGICSGIPLARVCF